MRGGRPYSFQFEDPEEFDLTMEAFKQAEEDYIEEYLEDLRESHNN